MRIDQNYIFSAFGNFDSIKPEHDTMAFFLNSFNGDIQLMPSVVQEMEWNEATGASELKQRLSLISPDSEIRVIIGSRRLDYGFVPNANAALDDARITEINQRICDAFSLILEQFSVKLIRLALNASSLLSLKDDNKVHNFIDRFSNPLSFYQESLHDLAEWSTRLNLRKETSIGGLQETCNIISTISKRNEGDGFLVNLDINTIPQNVSERFAKKESWQDFLQQAVKWRKLILKDVVVE